MNAEKRRIYLLLSKFSLEGKLTPEEEQEIEIWKNSSDANLEFYTNLQDEEYLLNKLSGYADERKKSIPFPIEFPKEKGRTFNLTTWWTAVASIVLLFVVVGYLFFYNKPDPAVSENLKPIAEVLPAKQQATLTINGTGVYHLDSIPAGVRVGGATKKVDGTLQYENIDRVEAVVNHTLSTPEGGFYSMILRDGTKVWMNAASSITYPSVFTGGERIVKLKGQAYFEVSKSSTNAPFIIETTAGTITVKGTHFDVKSYDDETFATTLLEGAVEIQSKDQTVVRKLKPGQQARIRLNSKEVTVNAVDPQVSVAWMKGLFAFDHTEFSDVIKEISRWYGAPVIYKDGARSTEIFVGDFDRKLPLSQLLEMVQGIAKVQLSLEDGKIIVKP